MVEQKISFGERLKRLREGKNLSVKEVADQINVPVTTYREWEHGRKIVGEPYVDLAKAFEISVHELITGQKYGNDGIYKSVEVIEAELKKIKENLLSK